MRDPNAKRRARKLPKSELIYCIKEDGTALDDQADIERLMGYSWSLFLRPDGVLGLSYSRKFQCRRQVRQKGEPYYYAWKRAESLTYHAKNNRLYGMEYLKGHSKYLRKNGVQGLDVLLQAPPEMRERFMEEAEKLSGKRFLRETHPLLPYFAPKMLKLLEEQEGRKDEARTELKSLPSAKFLPLLATDNPWKLVFKLFGREHKQKNLMKAALTVHPVVLYTAAAFRGLVPTDHLVYFLEHAQREGWSLWARDTEKRLRELSLLLAVLPPESLRDLLRREEFTPHHLYLLQDSVRQAVHHDWQDLTRVTVDERFRHARVRTWQELHDLPQREQLAARQRRLAAQLKEAEEAKVEHGKLAQALHGSTVDDLTLTCAETEADLITWGEALHNCMAGYRHEAREGHTLVGVVHRGEKLLAGWEVRNGKLKQLLGPHNQDLRDEVRLPLEEHFAAQELDVSRYWGKPGWHF